MAAGISLNMSGGTPGGSRRHPRSGPRRGETVRRHAARIIRRWTSGHSNARLEALNGLFQAARARARGYRNTTTFACIIYLIGAPIGDLFGAGAST